MFLVHSLLISIFILGEVAPDEENSLFKERSPSNYGESPKRELSSLLVSIIKQPSAELFRPVHVENCSKENLV